jgi:hypothetical protein
MSETAPPRYIDWDMLAAWLEAEWLATDRQASPLHRGLYEAYSAVADVMRDSPPKERENRLYQMLRETLTAGEEPAQRW